MNKFEELSKINVNDHIEKKGNLSYLSWVWAVQQISVLDENASWEYREFDCKPFLTLPDGSCMVYCTVTLFGKQRTAHLPVMDYKMKAVINPDSFAVNTTMQRALVKAIALHGLGLYIYAGEDLPEKEPPAAITPTAGAWESMDVAQQKGLTDLSLKVMAVLKEGDASLAVKIIDDAKLEAEEKIALWSRFDSKQRAAMKKAASQPKETENAV